MDRQNESRANNEDLRNEQNTQMLETGIGADVFFLVGEEKELIAGHKSVLEEGSPVFEAQFRHGNSNVLVSVGSREKPIEVPDVRPNAFDAMIRFIHTRELRGMNKQIVLDVYVAGKKYMIDALVNQCRQWLLNNGQSLDVKNVLAVLKFAQFHEDKVLIKHCWSFMHKNAKAVIDSEDFLLLEEADLREMFSPAAVSALFESFDWYRPPWFSRDAKAHLLDTGKGANMHFLVGEEKELISAHNFMLSDVFQSNQQIAGILEGSTKERPIPVPDVRPDAFRALLRYIYANDFSSSVTKQNVLDVYKAGNKYMITALVNECRLLLMYGQNCFGMDNVLSVLKHASSHNDEILCSHCWTFVNNNAKAVLNSEEFLTLDQHHLCELFSRNNLIVDELFLFESLHRWAFYQCVAAGLEETAENMRDFIGLFWSNNRWHISDRKLVQATSDGLVVTKKVHCRYLMSQNGDYAIVRARQHVSRAIFAILPELKLVYYEVLVKKSDVPCIGWIDRDLPQRTQTQWIGFRGSFSIYIDWVGNLLESGHKTECYGNGFDEGDVVGSGITQDGRIFFTLNGQLNGEPIALENTSQDLMLYPVINLYRKDASVEANFGSDPTRKPFMFDINAHAAQLFQ